MSRWDAYWYQTGTLARMPRNSDDTVRDGKSNTLLLSENLEARNWYDELTMGDPNPLDQSNPLTSQFSNNAFSTAITSGSSGSAPTTATNSGYYTAPLGGATLTQGSGGPHPPTLRR